MIYFLKLLLVILCFYANSAYGENPLVKCIRSLSPSYRNAQLEVTKASVTTQRLNKWLDQFNLQDQVTALKLVNHLNIISYSDLLLHLKQLYQDLLNIKDIDESKIDYTYAYTAKSGGLISYFFRKVNQIRSARFFNTQELAQQKEDVSDRTLVVLDDYAGTGAQFIAELYAQQHSSVYNRYKKIIYVVVSAHQKAIESFRQIQEGEKYKYMLDMTSDFEITGEAQEHFLGLTKNIAEEKLSLLYALKETPLLEDSNISVDQRQRFKSFLERNGQFDGTFGPFGVGHLQSSTVFFYGPPNTVPEIFWNNLGTINGNPILPLFFRTEDISHYEFSKGIPESEHIWGAPFNKD